MPWATESSIKDGDRYELDRLILPVSGEVSSARIKELIVSGLPYGRHWVVRDNYPLFTAVPTRDLGLQLRNQQLLSKVELDLEASAYAPGCVVSGYPIPSHLVCSWYAEYGVLLIGSNACSV